MESFGQAIVSAAADRFPVIAAKTKRYFGKGPVFHREGDQWLIEDNTGRIFVPYIRRYGMYVPNVAHRISFMRDRYPFDDLTGALIIDVGAHVGEYAMAASPLAAKIISFEPDPIARGALVRNVAALPNVEVRDVALSNTNGSATFYVATEHADSSLYQPDAYARAIEVKAQRLDSLDIDTSGYRHVLLKMDAEGFEPEVLEGAGDWLKNFTGVAIDVAPERAGQSTYAEVRRLLESAGLIERCLTDDQVLYACRP